nr:PREDICTED: uncharacterized protein LOC109033902 isoform X4 [Bemisia tabaci]
MNPVRNHPLRLLEFCFLTLLFLLTRGSSACVPLLSACVLAGECCDHPKVVCRAGTCYTPRGKMDKFINALLEDYVRNKKVVEQLRHEIAEAMAAYDIGKHINITTAG